jgi:uncharacterized protein
MSLVTVLGYFSALMIGVTLGLIGGGGSILTVPALVYLLGTSPMLATAYSLFVVGSTSLVGAVGYMRKGLINYQAGVVFAIPSFISVFLTRKYLVPAIPDPIFTAGGFIMPKAMGIMVFFATIMLMAAYSMISNQQSDDTDTSEKLQFNFPLIALEGAVVGVVTGLVGAGGGFLIIPTLVLLAKLPMKMAVGTSLLIIAAKSLIGFLGDVGEQVIDWHFLLSFTAVSVIGIFFGTYLSKFIPSERLKKAFGWFVLMMGGYIMWKELSK